jgi:proteic killer suppression protein
VLPPGARRDGSRALSVGTLVSGTPYTSIRYTAFEVAIRSFASRTVEGFFLEGRVSTSVGWARIATVAARKLDMLDYAERLADLASPPGNRLEALKGRLLGFHGIRVNDRWRVVFRWTESGPAEVDIVDYH